MRPNQIQGDLAIDLAARAASRYFEIVRVDLSHRYCSFLRLIYVSDANSGDDHLTEIIRAGCFGLKANQIQGWKRIVLVTLKGKLPILKSHVSYCSLQTPTTD